jgi:uncharacterized protein YraI
MAQTAPIMVAVSLVMILSGIAFLAVGFISLSQPQFSPMSVEQRNASIVVIAQQFDATQDRELAQVALMQLGLPDSSQAVLALAESYIAQDGDVNTTIQLIELARALGPVSRMAEEFLAREGLSPGAPAAVVIAQTATPTETSVSRPQASTDSPINVRSGPGVDYPVTGQLQPGQPVDILGRNADGTWWQVLLPNGDKGWVAVAVTDMFGPVDGVAMAANIPSAPALDATPTPEPVRLVINNAILSVRSGPGTNYGIIGQARNGERYGVTGKDTAGNWYEISFNGQIGWVAARYVVLEGNAGIQVAANIPVPGAQTAQPSTVASPIAPPAPSSPFSLVQGVERCVPDTDNTSFEGFVRTRDNSLMNGVCVHIAFYGPRNTKCSGCDGVDDGSWGFSPFGDPAPAGTTVEIFVVECPSNMPPGGQTVGSGFGDLTPRSEKWVRTISTSEQCTGITFVAN